MTQVIFQGDPTGRTDSYPAMVQTLQQLVSASVNPRDGGLFRGTDKLIIPKGNYYFSDTIELKGCTFVIEGEGNGMAGGEATVLRFAEGKHGFIIQRFNTTGATTAPNTTGADGSILQGLTIESMGGAVCHGVWARSRFLARDVRVRAFPGDGYHVVATSGAGGAAEGNANSFMIQGGRVESCGGAGLYVAGNDANAGLVYGLDVTGCRTGGVLDDSYLGNTYVAVHTAANLGPPYRTSNSNARCMFLNCYSEEGQDPAYIVSPAIVLGGLHGAGVEGSGLYVRSDEQGYFRIKTGLRSTVGDLTSTFGGDPTFFVSWGHNSNAPLGWRWQPEGPGRDLRLAYGGQDASKAITVLGPNTFHHLGAHKVIMRSIGLGLDDGDSHRLLTSAASPPGGNWDNGAVCFNNQADPSFNNVDYWIRKNGSWQARP